MGNSAGSDLASASSTVERTVASVSTMGSKRTGSSVSTNVSTLGWFVPKKRLRSNSLDDLIAEAVMEEKEKEKEKEREKNCKRHQ